MPQYEYLCSSCDKKFSSVLTLADHDQGKVKCPKCGSTKVEQQWAAFFATTSKSWAESCWKKCHQVSCVPGWSLPNVNRKKNGHRKSSEKPKNTGHSLSTTGLFGSTGCVQVTYGHAT